MSLGCIDGTWLALGEKSRDKKKLPQKNLKNKINKYYSEKEKNNYITKKGAKKNNYTPPLYSSKKSLKNYPEN